MVFVSVTCGSISGVTRKVLNWSFINSSQKSRTGEYSLQKGIGKFKVNASKYNVILSANYVRHISQHIPINAE